MIDCGEECLPNSKACAEHQEDYQRYRRMHSREEMAGVRRVLQRPGEREEWQAGVQVNNQPHNEPVAPVPMCKNYFGPARHYCVETIVAPCGAVIAWANFARSESPTNILNFLESVFPTPDSKPSYICIDKACVVLKTVMANPHWRYWMDTSRFIVDTYHYRNHKRTDEICRTWCNPAPTDGSAPNLVVVNTDEHGVPYLKRAFNTQACEQLNAWLGGFQLILKRMTSSNFNWFLHVMLYYHTKFVLQKKQK